MKQAICLIAIAILLLGAPAMTNAADKPLPGKEDVGGKIEVDMIGVVRAGVMAIGGESTGTTITALGFTWELDLQGNEEHARLAEKSNGKELAVQGTLTVKQGVERGRRVIVVVKKMTPVTK